MSTVQSALAAANKLLAAQGIQEPARDTRKLIAACLDIPSDRVLMNIHDPLGDVTEAAFFAMVQLRLDQVPVSRILGVRAFYGRDFTVTPDVLDPRPETETLIASALNTPFQTLLDLGTGSGAIAITLLAERSTAKGVATDISHKALSVAAKNAQLHGVSARLGLVESNWFGQVDQTFDLIVSNPPYIALDEMDGLDAEVREHDPRIALTDEDDGLSAYRDITNDAVRFLNQGGSLIVEIGPTQGDVVRQMFKDSGLQNVQVATDLDGRDRVVVGLNG